MGSTPSIAQLEQQSEQFSTYMDSIRTKCETLADQGAAALDKAIADFLGAGAIKDAQTLVSGKNFDFAQVSEWSLANVAKILSAISGALFDPSQKTPDGVTVDVPKEIATSVTATADMEVYLASKALDVVSGIIGAIDFSASSSNSEGTKVIEVAPGWIVAIYAAGAQYSDNGFFQNTKIQRAIYVYKTLFSAARAKADATFYLVENEVAELEAQVDKIKTIMDGLTPTASDPAAYTKDLNAWMAVNRNIAKQIATLKTKAAAVAAT